MHNTPLANKEFELQFSETNMRWLLGNPFSPENEEKISKGKKIIEQIKKDLEELKKKDK